MTEHNLSPRASNEKHWPDHWNDTGCELNPSCLSCPLPKCQYDAPRVRGISRKGPADRNALILARLAAGEATAGIAAEFGITQRTVFRIRA